MTMLRRLMLQLTPHNSEPRNPIRDMIIGYQHEFPHNIINTTNSSQRF